MTFKITTCELADAVEASAMSLPFCEAVMYLHTVSGCELVSADGWARMLAQKNPHSTLGESHVLRES